MLLQLLQVSLSLTVLVLSVHYARRRMRSLPPGPLGIPVLGNTVNMPTTDEAQTITSWSKYYGNMIYITLAGTPFLYLNNIKECNDLLEKRSALYSDRFQPTVATKLAGMSGLVPLTPYGDRFRVGRRLMNIALSARAVANWEPIIAEETHMMLERLMTDPDNYVAHIKRMAGSLIFNTTYGHRVTSDDDPYIQDAEELATLSSSVVSGRWMVDFLPFLRHIPGLPIHQKAEEWKAKMLLWVEKPFKMFKDTVAEKPDDISFCRTLLFPDDGSQVDADTEDLIKWLATSMYGAGADTTVTSLSTFILALIRHPNAMRKAQQEIERVIGRSRLPTLADRSRLPYVEAILKESFRWGTPVPLTFPHRLSQADEYNGYILPEGTLCVANIWSMMHDETLFPEPSKFKPERYLEKMDAEHKRLIDPSTYIFGFGRRRCPGVHFANLSTWFSAASLLACFDFLPPLDENGHEVIPPEKFMPGVLRHPAPFKCRIVPRHEGVTALLEAAQPQF